MSLPGESRKEGLGAMLSQASVGGRYDLGAAIGGWRGIVDATVPSTLFLIVWTITQELRPSLWVAVGVAAVLTLWRLLRREGVQHAFSGLVGIGFCAFVANRTGQAADFFLLSLIKNPAYGVGYLISILVRWPLIGVIAGMVTGQGTAWRRDPRALRAYSLASWVWVGMFFLRFVVQLPLYLTDSVTTLGIVNVVLGLPLFALTLWLTWLLIRDVVRHHVDSRAEPAGGDVAAVSGDDDPAATGSDMNRAVPGNDGPAVPGNTSSRQVPVPDDGA